MLPERDPLPERRATQPCFALPDDATLDRLPGDHLYAHATIDGKPVKRPYMPSSTPRYHGVVDLTVRRYETGVMSKYLHDREVGEQVLMSGPNPGGVCSLVDRFRCSQ